MNQHAGASPHPGGPAWRVYGHSLFMRPDSNPVAALTFADPPYNQGIDYGAASGKLADKLSDADYLDFTRRWLRKAVAGTRPGGAVWVLISDEWAAEVRWIATRELGLVPRNWIKWHETFGVQTTHKFARCSRHVLYFAKPPLKGEKAKTKPTFNAGLVTVPSARQEVYNDPRAAEGGKVPGDVWTFSRVAGTFSERAEGFPTQIPEALLKRVVLATSHADEKVLEFFAGSGSLGRVCAELGRGYEGWETNPEYARMGAARIEEKCREVREAKRLAPKVVPTATKKPRTNSRTPG